MSKPLKRGKRRKNLNHRNSNYYDILKFSPRWELHFSNTSATTSPSITLTALPLSQLVGGVTSPWASPGTWHIWNGNGAFSGNFSLDQKSKFVEFRDTGIKSSVFRNWYWIGIRGSSLLSEMKEWCRESIHEENYRIRKSPSWLFYEFIIIKRSADAVLARLRWDIKI